MKSSCAGCASEFTAVHPTQLFCTHSCYQRDYYRKHRAKRLAYQRAWQKLHTQESTRYPGQAPLSARVVACASTLGTLTSELLHERFGAPLPLARLTLFRLCKRGRLRRVGHGEYVVKEGPKNV